MENYQLSTLANGVQVVSESIEHVKSVSLGIWVRVGSRYENEKNNGVTHFIEHMLFKGTENRSAKEIAEEVDSMGGQLNAFTAKEYTCYYIRMIDENLAQGMDILADMLLKSKLDENDIDKERSVIEEEIKMYADAPDELANDLFNNLVWPDHPLGRPILGTEETLANIDRKVLVGYMKEMYTASNIVIACAGKVEHEELVKLAEKYFGFLPKGERNQCLPAPEFNFVQKWVNKETEQVQICMGAKGVANNDSDEQYQMSVLNAYLGGGMSSRLVQKVREEMSMAYSIYSYHSAYSDVGLWGIAAATREENCREMVKIILDELHDVAQNGISEAALKRVLGQFKGSIYLGNESVSSRMNRLGRSLMYQKKVVMPEEVIARLEKVTSADVKALAAKLFTDNKMALLALGEVDEEPLAEFNCF